MQSRRLPKDGGAGVHRWHIRRRPGGAGPGGLSAGFTIPAAAGIAMLVLSCGDGAVEPAPPPAPVATTVTVNPASAAMSALGETVRFTAEVRDQNGQVMAGTAVAWASGEASVATVDASGLATAEANGSATITATAGPVSGSAAVTVAQEASAVAVSPGAGTVVAGDTLRLRAEATDANGYAVIGAEFTWASSDTLVARVDDFGLVIGVKAGEAAITAVSGVATGRVELVVTRARWTLSGTISHGWADPQTNGFGDGANYRLHIGSARQSNRQRYLDVGAARRRQRHVGGVRGLGTGTPAITTPDGKVVGAVVEIVDGPDAGSRAITDDSGYYVLEGIEQAQFAIGATAEGFASVSGVVNLTSDRVLDFAISELPVPQPPSSFPDTDPTWLKMLASDYPYVHQVANVRVFSDISLDFSREHAEHLKRVWDFFNGLYARNRGDYIDVYYTMDPAIYLKAGTEEHCGEEIIRTDARNVNACYLEDYPRWFIIPYQIPDYGTQLHEFGHDFLFATVYKTRSVSYRDIGWFVEGTAMYLEGGVFNDSGSLRVPKPLPWCISGFRRYDQQNRLNPLTRLLHATERGFWQIAGGYQQTCMLFDYLERHEPGVLYALIDRINSGQILSNDHLVTALLDLSGKSVSELEGAYQSQARQWASSNRDDDA